MRLTRRNFIALTGAAAGSAVFAPAIVRAQEAFPTRPINMVNPFSAGGYVDRMARAYASHMEKTLKQPVTQISKPGASGMLGHSFFLQQPDDGYTILASAPAPFIIQNVLLQGAPYKVDSFDIINTPARDFTLLACATSKPLQSIDDVLKALKDNPGSLSIGVQAASADYVNLMLMADAAGVDRSKMRIVTYDGGGPTRNAVAGGVVDIGLVGGEGFLPIKNMIRPLVAFDDRRSSDYDAPTIQEAFGDKKVDYMAGSHRGFAVHPTLKQKHPDRYQAIHDAVKAVSDDAAAVEAIKKQDLEADWYGPEESTEAYMRTYEVMKKHMDLLKG